jgi:hypothetical protein
MGFMKSLDIVLDKYKLTDPQKNAVVDLLSEADAIKTVTAKALERKGLVHWTENGLWELDESFHTELKAAYSQPEPREVEEILPGETIEITGSYAGGHSQAEILELLGEEDTKSVEAPVIPFFNRKARREFRRNIARYNRRLMRLHGKRARKYGPQNIVIRHIAA